MLQKILLENLGQFPDLINSFYDDQCYQINIYVNACMPLFINAFRMSLLQIFKGAEPFFKHLIIQLIDSLIEK